jgi:hypothetical protein
MLLSSGRVDGSGGQVSRKKLSREEYLAERERREKKFSRTRLIRRGLF